MRGATHPDDISDVSPVETSGKSTFGTRSLRIRVVSWLLAFALFIISCVVMATHPAPFPFELAVTQTVQGLPLWPWLLSVLEFPSVLNNPIPSVIALSCWVGGLLLIALIARLRSRSGRQWLLAALFLLATVMSSAGLNVIIDELVARPRPDPHTQPIRVDHPLVPFPTYPSGHTEHDVVYYGFLVYLSLSEPVRRWRYRWLLLPLQLYALFDILSIGFSRILEGDHWLLDILGGYLEGAIYLTFFIFLYQWTSTVGVAWIARYFANKRLR